MTYCSGIGSKSWGLIGAQMGIHSDENMTQSPHKIDENMTQSIHMGGVGGGGGGRSDSLMIQDDMRGGDLLDELVVKHNLAVRGSSMMMVMLANDTIQKVSNEHYNFCEIK